MQQPQRLLRKSDFKLLYGMVIGAHIIAGLILKFDLPIIIIACCSVFISLAIAFFKLLKKLNQKKELYWIWGVVSIFNAVIMSLYFSLFINKDLKYKALVFVICLVVVAIICISMKLLCSYFGKKTYSDTQKPNPSRTAKHAKTGTVLGTILGIYLIRSGLIPGLTHGHLILACCILLFSLLSVFLYTATFIGENYENNNLH